MQNNGFFWTDNVKLGEHFFLWRWSL